MWCGLHPAGRGKRVHRGPVGAQIAANTGQDPRPSRREDANDPLYNYYRCRDEAWVALGMVIHKEMFWPKVCAVLGDPELATDARVATPELREENARELVEILDGLFAKIDYADWDRASLANDFIASKVNALTDLADDPQGQAIGYLVELPHPDFGTWTYVATPLDFSETPVSIRNPAPHVGQDNAAILQDWLGMGADEVTGLVEREVL